MRTLSFIAVITFLLAGCSSSPDAAKPSCPSAESAAIASLNRQIDDFNALRQPDMGISPIERQVVRVAYDRYNQQVQCFDKDDRPFLILKRESDGSFKGILEQPYHQLAGSGPDGSHSWGHILAEFNLEKSLFPE